LQYVSTLIAGRAGMVTAAILALAWKLARKDTRLDGCHALPKLAAGDASAGRLSKWPPRPIAALRHAVLRTRPRVQMPEITGTVDPAPMARRTEGAPSMADPGVRVKAAWPGRRPRLPWTPCAI